MADAAEYRKRAQECLDMAPKMSPEYRLLLISIAGAWVALAEAALAKELWLQRAATHAVNRAAVPTRRTERPG